MKYLMWYCKFLEITWRIGSGIILGGYLKIPVDDSEDKTKEEIIIKKLSNNMHNGLTLEQYGIVWFHFLKNFLFETKPMGVVYVDERS